jgi:hypothetical protein
MRGRKNERLVSNANVYRGRAGRLSISKTPDRDLRYNILLSGLPMKVKTLIDVAEELRKMDSQFVNDRNNPFAKMAKVVEDSVKTIQNVDRVLRVPAAEYVPAFGDAFTLIDKLGVVDL